MVIKVLDHRLYAEEVERGFAPKKPGDAGIDLRAAETTEVGHRQTAVIPLGVAVGLPDSSVGWLTGRSSSTLSFGVITHEGKIDSGYRGEIHAVITALERGITIQRGERIAQLVVLSIAPPPGDGWDIVTELDDTERGGMGLGSTGRT